MAAECVFVLAETRALTVHAIYAVWAHPVPAVRTAEARLAQTGSIDVVAARTVSTVAHAFAVLSVTTCSTLLLTPVTSEAFSTLTLSSFSVTFSVVVANTLLSTVWPKPSFWTSLGTDWTRPSRWASADPFAFTDATILARTSRLAFPPTRGLTVRPCESTPTNALSRCFIAGSSGCTLAPLQAALPKRACWTRLFAVASIEPWRTATRSLHRVAESSVLTLALLLAVRSPVFIVTVAGAVVSSPASLALAAIWSDTPAVDALLSAARDTSASTLVVAWTALVSLAVISLHRLPVGCFVGDPVAHAFVGCPWIPAGLLSHLVIRMQVGLLYRGGEALPRAAHIGVSWVQRAAQSNQDAKKQQDGRALQGRHGPWHPGTRRLSAAEIFHLKSDFRGRNCEEKRRLLSSPYT